MAGPNSPINFWSAQWNGCIKFWNTTTHSNSLWVEWYHYGRVGSIQWWLLWCPSKQSLRGVYWSNHEFGWSGGWLVYTPANKNAFGCLVWQRVTYKCVITLHIWYCVTKIYVLPNTFRVWDHLPRNVGTLWCLWCKNSFKFSHWSDAQDQQVFLTGQEYFLRLRPNWTAEVQGTVFTIPSWRLKSQTFLRCLCQCAVTSLTYRVKGTPPVQTAKFRPIKHCLGSWKSFVCPPK